MQFRVGTYGLNFCPDFLKLFLKIEKLISFVRIYIFSLSVYGNKSYDQISLNQGRGGNKKNLLKNGKSFFWIFSHWLYFCLCGNLSFIPFGFVMRNLWIILFLGQLEHIPEKITCRIHFLMQFLQLKKSSMWFSFFPWTISSLGLVYFNSI